MNAMVQNITPQRKSIHTNLSFDIFNSDTIYARLPRAPQAALG
jgi:hypothetical protein